MKPVLDIISTANTFFFLKRMRVYILVGKPIPTDQSLFAKRRSVLSSCSYTCSMGTVLAKNSHWLNGNLTKEFSWGGSNIPHTVSYKYAFRLLTFRENISIILTCQKSKSERSWCVVKSERTNCQQHGRSMQLVLTHYCQILRAEDYCIQTYIHMAFWFFKHLHRNIDLIMFNQMIVCSCSRADAVSWGDCKTTWTE